MSTIKKENILKIYVASVISETGYTNNDFRNGKFVGSNITLYDALYTLPLKWKDKLIDTMSMEYHSDEQEYAKSLLPRYYISGIYDMNEYIIRFPIHDYPKVESNLMTIDIDGKDNTDIDIWKLREEIFKLPYVFSCLKSCSGKGFYCIIPIEDTHYTKEYYDYITNLWKDKYGLKVDSYASSLVRARIISYNEDIDSWIKDEVSIWKLKDPKIKEEMKEESLLFSYKPKKEYNSNWDNITHSCMVKIIDDGYTVNDYKAWYHLGCELANFDDGYELFYKMSKNYDSSQSDSSIKKRWKGCKASGIDDNLIRKWCGMAKNRYGKNWLELLTK